MCETKELILFMHAFEIFEKLYYDVQIIKQKNGKNRGFAFVTMASPEEANAAIEKFNSYVSISLDNCIFLTEKSYIIVFLVNFVEKKNLYKNHILLNKFLTS